MRYELITILALSLAAFLTSDLSAQRAEVAEGLGQTQIPYSVFEPGDYDAAETYPVLVVPRTSSRPQTRLLTELAGGGWVVVGIPAGSDSGLSAILRRLRLTYRIESQRFFAITSTGADGGRERGWLVERRHDFHIVLRSGQLDAAATRQLLTAARRGQVPKSTGAAAVAAVLDDFHDCAAKADGPRYFDHFAPKGVFLGTDATERWPQAEFREWGAKHFAGQSAWIYVPQERNIDIDGDVAWFDEILHSDSYGECRGSGTLQRIAGVWKIAQYHLTVPVPNPLMRDVVAMIRGVAKPAGERGTINGATTVFVVRHAEKQKGGEDPLLTVAGRDRAQRLARILRSVELDAAFSTQYRRTQLTIAPSCKAQGIAPTVVDAKIDVSKRILTRQRGKTVLVAGHSNTVPNILRRLGVAERIRIRDSDYDDLFIVTIQPDGVIRFLHLHY